MTDAYCYTDELSLKLMKDRNLQKVLKEFSDIKGNGQKVKYMEELLLSKNLIPNEKESMKKKKCDSQAELHRDKGNKHFNAGRFYEALESYNKSLCFAPENGENVGLAFANRSAVYCELKLYSRSLKNIEEAIKHNYPQKNMDKLKKREELCKKMIEQKVKEPSAEAVGDKMLKINLELNPKLPFAAKCLELKSDEKHGRYIVTNKNLSSGDIVIVEKPFSKTLHSTSAYKYCTNCLNDNCLDLIPCVNCTSAMFCSQECCEIATKKFHQYECCTIDQLNSIYTKILKMASQTFFEALDIFDSDIRKLTDVIESKPSSATIFDYDMSDEQNDISKKRENMLMAVDSFVTHEHMRSNQDMFQRCGIVAIMTHIFLNYTKLKDVLNTEEKKDLYRKFIVKHTQISALSNHGLGAAEPVSFEAMAEIVPIGSASFPLASLVNHSCSSNTLRFSFNGKLCLIVNRPIRAGETLYDNYGAHHCLETLAERQTILKEKYLFKCACEACIYDYPLMDNLKMTSPQFHKSSYEDTQKLYDLDYHFALDHFKNFCRQLDKLDKNYPCVEVSILQEKILRCINMFIASPLKFEIYNRLK